MTTVLLLAALDTKGADAAFIQTRIREHGLNVTLVDTGVLGQPSLTATISRDQVAAAGGTTIADLVSAQDRGQAVAIMAKGAAIEVERLIREDGAVGVFGIGGGAGTSVAAAAMRNLPLGIPKVVLSTVASGDTSAYVGTSDIVMFPSIVDVAGVNRISAITYTRAADAFAGMVNGQKIEPTSAPTRPLIAASMFGVTTPAILHAQQLLENAGYEVVVFHATGVGGRAMESLIRQGLVDAVLDLTTTEVTDDIVGGILSAGPERLTAAAEAGVPQVVSVGATDMANFGPLDTVPPQHRERNLYQHNSENTLMRINPDEARQVGVSIAVRLNHATAPAIILLPSLGVSVMDAAGKGFDDPVARRALEDALAETLENPLVQIKKLNIHINDHSFAELAVTDLIGLLSSSTSTEMP
ncbi:Tm-1-like ATP-binding domain-containing protein [Microbacterium murale]|uniref:Uncharacterized protein n=1 Tax=Microbacterium murale TaxID=1081040 RepID=A0ABQ1RKQ0_9MICO|nr:Tm-1-like ATP-binding domain-containing protein [Microbacterium murale]GGD70189.1 hypothetical protein GCM10007269_11770 [Microbacterium murale]